VLSGGDVVVDNNGGGGDHMDVDTIDRSQRVSASQGISDTADTSQSTSQTLSTRSTTHKPDCLFVSRMNVVKHDPPYNHIVPSRHAETIDVMPLDLYRL